MKYIVISQHPFLGEYLIQRGLVPQGTPVVTRASFVDVQGRHIFTTLPDFALAAQAEKVTYVTLAAEPHPATPYTLDQLDDHVVGLEEFVVVRAALARFRE